MLCDAWSDGLLPFFVSRAPKPQQGACYDLPFSGKLGGPQATREQRGVETWCFRVRAWL